MSLTSISPLIPEVNPFSFILSSAHRPFVRFRQLPDAKAAKVRQEQVKSSSRITSSAQGRILKHDHFSMDCFKGKNTGTPQKNMVKAHGFRLRFSQQNQSNDKLVGWVTHLENL